MLSLQCVSNRVWAECQTGTAPTCLRWPFFTPSASHSQVCAALPLRICAERLLWVNPSVGQNPSHPPLYEVTRRFRHHINTLYLSPKLQYYKPQSVVTDIWDHGRNNHTKTIGTTTETTSSNIRCAADKLVVLNHHTKSRLQEKQHHLSLSLFGVVDVL